MSNFKKALYLVLKGIFILFLLISYVLSKELGMTLLFPVGGAFLSYWFLKKIKKIDEFVLLAFSVQAGQLLWIIIGCVYLKDFTRASFDILILVIGLSWLVIKFNLWPLLILLVYQVCALKINLVYFHSPDISTEAFKGLIVHVVFRSLAIFLMLWLLIELAFIKKEINLKQAIGGVILVVILGLSFIFVQNKLSGNISETGVQTNQNLTKTGENQYQKGVDAHNAGKNTEAFQFFYKSAEAGYVQGESELGYVYLEGLGTPKNYEEAVRWFEKSANQGQPYGEFNLGNCYFHGWGVIKDQVEAAKWFQKAADQGDADSEFDLGFCYYNGWGVKKDLEQSKHWFQLAADQNYPRAKEALASLSHN